MSTRAYGADLTDRVRDILIQPRAEWERVAAAPPPAMSVLTRHVVPLALLAGLISFAGGLLSAQAPVFAALTSLVFFLALIVGVYIWALAIDLMAPLFGGESEWRASMALAGYAATPVLLGIGFQTMPAPLSWISLISIYAIFVLNPGVGRIKKTTDTQSMQAWLAMSAAGLVILFLVFWVCGLLGAVLPAR
ncbi:MAG: Yip1 family protein [Caulobacterales bacterium]